MRVQVVTDAWSPQVNGVVTTLKKVGDGLQLMGHTVDFVTPELFRSFPCPTYPEIKLSVMPYRKLSRAIERFRPDALHIATEGPLGIAARRYCVKHGLSFTTAFHTRFPEYVQARTAIPASLTYRWLQHFHKPSKALMVPTPAVRRDLQDRGFSNTVSWTHGVDTETFSTGERELFRDQRPIFLYVGRVAVEKNIEAFLALDLPGTKWVVGEGPQRAKLESRYSSVRFSGIKSARELARYYRGADVLVFPSLTDTFGLVMLEALACGTPVAAFPVMGPIDVIGESGVGVLDTNLRRACLRALDVPRTTARKYAEQFGWERSVSQFLGYLTPLNAAA
jgi:glycosyltransferase involved in cell wall biosynthesis